VIQCGLCTTASDIYALGAVFYETLTGKHLFLTENTTQLIGKIIEELPLEPISYRPEIPKDINRFIMRMIHKRPEQRPNLAEVIEFLSVREYKDISMGLMHWDDEATTPIEVSKS
jgi:serine/threonine protein kinase